MTGTPMAGKGIIGLGLESSCDETAAAVVRDGREVLSNIIFSQVDLHRVYYGVVPEIASRSHLETINGLIDEALSAAGVTFGDLDYVAATSRPGLVGSLLIALQSAKAISYILDIPLVPVNHLEAHCYAPFLEGHEPEFPFIALLVSGGNTVLYQVNGTGDMEIIGRTGDDAVGEAFDKVAKFLDLGYPGGPAVEKLARTARGGKVPLPKILPEESGYRFSFSGIKTAVVNYRRNNPDTDTSELVHSFQERALEILVRHLFSAARERGITDLVVAGGVACNGRLRELLHGGLRRGERLLVPSPALCTDNAAMVAGIGYRYCIDKRYGTLESDVAARVEAG